MSIEEIFPGAVLGQKPVEGDWVSIERHNQVIYLPAGELTERERYLLGMLDEESKDTSLKDPWLAYFLGEKEVMPLDLSKVQLVYIEHQFPFSAELVELMEGLLANVVAMPNLTPTRSLMILDQTKVLDARVIIEDLLPTIESDFAMSLTVAFGNTWSNVRGSDLQAYFADENRLFSDYLMHRGETQTVTFASLALWALVNQLAQPSIKKKVLQQIGSMEDMSDVITRLWQEHGNLMQTAQHLFIHRNSLQYKLDKFQSLSGLNLKNLDDLAYCYLLIQEI
ncbi:helix-turn-helix domain-containing protein [Streptococcus sp. HF-1907]|uniref:helix-turn-helix domain-containing protein n=1 Tax=Streptococcus sp. HF-1907 TaxID=2785793 RepID=UPI00189D1FDB|nr:helix-turn-helix domain-containing protein [Streptococcus sp. HF-1907]MBF7094333.1 helix-turn-helix domain-containing protein [Streptococcus sp. HF-1907]